MSSPDPAKPASTPGRPSLLPLRAEAATPRLRMLDTSAQDEPHAAGTRTFRWGLTGAGLALLAAVGALVWGLGRPAAMPSPAPGGAQVTAAARAVPATPATQSALAVTPAPVVPASPSPTPDKTGSPGEAQRVARVETLPTSALPAVDDGSAGSKAGGDKANPAGKPAGADEASGVDKSKAQALAGDKRHEAGAKSKTAAKRQQLAKARRANSRDTQVAAKSPATRRTASAGADQRSTHVETSRTAQVGSHREVGPASDDPDAALIGAVMAHIKRKPATSTAAAKVDASAPRRGD